MNNKKYSLTIGIPALNEENNILYILDDILRQKCNDVVIDKIIVNSDGSTDKTVEKARRLKCKNILVLENQLRMGAPFRQNEMLELSSSDFFLMLNADIRIQDQNFINKMVSYLVTGGYDLVSGKLEPQKPLNLFQNILFSSWILKELIAKEHLGGKSVLTCHGPVRLFSKKLYKKMVFPNQPGEDAYSYFYCITNGYKYGYCQKAIAYYKLPMNFKDHKKQSTRYFQGPKRFSNMFSHPIVKNNYSIDIKTLLISYLKTLADYPIYLFFYTLISQYIKIVSSFSKMVGVKWDIAHSSK